MPVIASTARSLGAGSESSQSLLQHTYFVAAVVLIFLVVVSRLVVLRRRNQALSDFFHLRSTPRYSDPYGLHPTHESDYDSVYRGVRLAPLPAAYRSDRRVHAADVDAHGRRLGPSGEDWDGKDALPAYDNSDRPPKYVDLGGSHGGPAPPHVDLLSAATLSSPIREQVSNVPNEGGGNLDESGTHTSAARDTTEVALPPPIHFVPTHS